MIDYNQLYIDKQNYFKTIWTTFFKLFSKPIASFEYFMHNLTT